MNEIRAGLDAIKTDLVKLNGKVNKLTEELEEHKNNTTSELANLHISYQTNCSEITLIMIRRTLRRPSYKA